MRIQCENWEQRDALIKRIFFLAYNASSVMGMGVLQARGGMTEDQVYKNILGRGDYTSVPGMIYLTPKNTLHADYVFGRMMKTRVEYDGNTVVVEEDAPRVDYQSWARTYKSYDDLVKAAMEELNINSTVGV